MTLLGDVYDMCPLTDKVRAGEHRFQLYHVSTLAGPAPRNLKKILASIFNGKDINTLYELLKPIERRFKLKYWGRIDTLCHHSIAFINYHTGQPVVYKASKLRKISLKELAAQRVAAELGDIIDIESLIDQYLLPASLKTVLLKHL